MGHPSTIVLKRFSAGTASREEAAMVTAHLLGGCHSCAQQLRELSQPRAIGPGAYDAVFSRLETAVAVPPGPRAEKGDAELLLKELLSQPEARQEMLIRNGQRYLSPELALKLADHSFRLRYDGPKEQQRFARLAFLLAQRLKAEDPVDAAWIADVRTRCLSIFSNALKIASDLVGAERALTLARASLSEGTGDPALKVEVYERLASLRCNQRRFEEAIGAYEEAVELIRDSGTPHEVARALVGQAIAFFYAGDPERALELLEEAIPKIDGKGDPRLTLAACHAVVEAQIEAGRIEEAALNWIDLRSLYDKLGDPAIRIRQRWLEGKLMIAQGLIPMALKILESARSQCLERNLPYDAALISLDIGMGYLRLGRLEQLRNLMSEVLPVFQALQVGRESLVALIFLRKAAELEAPVPERPEQPASLRLS